MIALWMGYAVAVTFVLGLAALALDDVAGRRWKGRRWLWVAALTGAVAVPAWQASRTPALRPASAAAVPPGGAMAATSPSVGVAQLSASLAELLERARPEALGLDRLDAPLVVAWSAAAAALLLLYAGAMWLLGRAGCRWREATVDGEAVLVSAGAGPAVVGALRPRIVLPEWSLSLPADERALMLAHEREHVRARDPLLLHAATVTVLAMPWNVAAWWLLRRVRLAVELDCDARVLGSGRDARTYGTLLLSVCERRVRGAPLLAPALLERTSSLSRRILAMHPYRPRFPRARASLCGAAAVALVALACEAPSPEVLAPDGRDVAAQRLYGAPNGAAPGRSEVMKEPTELRALIGRYFPDVAKGETGPAMLIFIRNAAGEIVLTERGPADGSLLRATRRQEVDKPSATASGDTIRLAGTPARGIIRMRATGAPETGVAPAPDPSAVSGEPPVATMRAAPAWRALAALRPSEIASVEVSKHSAGKLTPGALSVIWIDLKPGAHVPELAPSR